jgi:uncharacterized Zn finger protein (UPF0148 family)
VKIMSYREKLEEWGEDHGYTRGRCPRCHRTLWTDTGYFECNYCGANMDTDEDELEGDEDEVRRSGR